MMYRKVKKETEVILMGGLVRTLKKGGYVKAFPELDTDDGYMVAWGPSPVRVGRDFLTKKLYSEVDRKEICR